MVEARHATTRGTRRHARHRRRLRGRVRRQAARPERGRRSSARRTSCSTRRSCRRPPPGHSSRATSSSRSARCAAARSSCSGARPRSTRTRARSPSRPTTPRSRSATASSSIALGAISRTLPIPGLAEHGLGFKSLADAIHLRNHVLQELERAVARADLNRSVAENLTYVFVGAGYAGVEALAELSDMVRDALATTRRLRRLPTRWVLVDAAPKILPEIPRRLGEYAARLLARRGVDIRVSTTLESVEAHAVTLSDGEPHPDEHARLDGRRACEPEACRVGAAARRARPRRRRRHTARRRATTTCGRSATARVCRTSLHPARSTRRPASTRYARRGASPRT